MTVKALGTDFKDSNIEWIGKVPHNWNIVRLRTATSIINGATPTSDEPKFWDGDIKWVTPEDLGKNIGHFISETRRSITKEGYKSCATSLIPEGSIILSTRAPIGLCAMNSVPMATNQGCRGIVLKNELVSDFGYYYLFSSRKVLDSFGTGSTFKELSRRSLADFPVPLPSRDVQKRVAAFLDEKTAIIDCAIEQKRKLIDLLKEKRTAIINHAVTRGLDKDTVLVDSGVEWIGRVPKGWRILKFKYLGRFVSGGTPATEKLEYWDGSIPWISPKDMKSDEIVDSEDHITPAGLANTAGAIVRAGSLLLVYRSGILRHSIPTAINMVDAAVNQDIRAVLLKESVNAKYLHYLVQGKVDVLLNIWSKNGATVESLEHDYVANTPMPLPSRNEQDEIVACLDEAMRLFSTACAEIDRSVDLLNEYRTSLISHAVTGKISI